MANIVQLKRSSVSGRIPDAANVEVGEPVVNLADQILYTKDGSGTIKIIGAGTTSNIAEGNNLYFTNARAVAAFTEGTGINIDANGLITSTVTGSSGGLSAWTEKTSNYTASVGDRVLGNTASSSFTITLPATPLEGEEVYIADAYNFYENNLTVGRNGNKIGNASEDLLLDVEGSAVQLVFDGVDNWNVYFYSLIPEPNYVTIASSPPSNPNIGDKWVDDTDGTEYVYVNDGTSSQWVNFSGTGVSVADDVSSSSTTYPALLSSTTGIFGQVNTSSTKLYYVPSTGTLSATDFNSLSDKNLKDNITSLSGDKNLLGDINPVSFTWKDTGNKSYGIIAQELEKIYPELVATNDAGIKSVSYIPLISMLIATVQEHRREIEILKDLINGN